MKRFDARSRGLVSLLLMFAAAVLAFIAFVVLAVVALVFGALSSPSSLMNAMGNGKSIEVVISHDGANDIHRHLIALNGASEGFSGGYGYSTPGQNVHFQSDENYKVIADPQGHFTVAMHRVVEENGAKTITDSDLPVWNTEPEASKRVKLPNGSTVVAYFTKDSH